MGRSDEVARFQRVQASKCWTKQWWDRASAIALLDGLLGDAPDQGRDALLICERGIKPNGDEVLWFRWGTKEDLTGTSEASTLTHDDGFNFSHPCPPCCPDCT